MGKKVSGAADYLVPLGILAIGGLAVWYFFKKGIPGLLESGANTQNNTSVDSSTAAAAAQLPTAGQTLSDADVNGLATTIYNAGSSNDSTGVIHALSELTNTADFNRLVQLFGTKSGSTSSFSTCSLLGFNCQSFDLYTWVRAILSSGEISELNSLLSANGINAQF
jgi:hypothetical protein